MNPMPKASSRVNRGRSSMPRKTTVAERSPRSENFAENPPCLLRDLIPGLGRDILRQSGQILPQEGDVFPSLLEVGGGRFSPAGSVHIGHQHPPAL